MGMAIKVLGFAWDNRKAIGRAYHHWVHHRVALDTLIDYAEENPKHPKKVREEQMKAVAAKVYDAAN